MYTSLIKNPDNIKEVDDDVGLNNAFANITTIYNENIIGIIGNVFELIEESNEVERLEYIRSLEQLLFKIKIDIQNYIHTQVLCI